MRFRTKHRHMIDLLFPVALFFVFALSALTVLLIAARIYQSTTEHSSLHDTSRTSLSYISEKLHQSDEAGSVSLGTFDGCDALIIQQTHGEHTYYTYIYSYEGKLRELFVKAGVNASASSGMAILEQIIPGMKNKIHSCQDFSQILLSIAGKTDPRKGCTFLWYVEAEPDLPVCFSWS